MAPAANQPKPAEETKPANGTTASEGSAPAAPPTENVQKWYDVDVVKGTQFTVTAYQVPNEDAESNVSQSVDLAQNRMSCMPFQEQSQLLCYCIMNTVMHLFVKKCLKI